MISGHLRAAFTIGGVDISLNKGIILEEVYLEDLEKDTLLYAEKLFIFPKEFWPEGDTIIFSSAKLSDGVIKLKKFRGGDTLNIGFLMDAFGKTDSADSSAIPGILVRSLAFSNIRFSYRDFNDTGLADISIHQPGGSGPIRFTDLQVNLKDALFDSLTVSSDSASCSSARLSFSEQCGLSLEYSSGRISFSNKNISAKNFEFSTGKTWVAGDITLSYDSWSDFSNYNKTIYHDIALKPSVLYPGDLTFLSHHFSGQQDSIFLSGRMTGTISNLKGSKLSINFGEKTKFSGSIALTGLPEISNTYIHLRVRQLLTYSTDIEKIIRNRLVGGENTEVPVYFRQAGQISFKGEFTGFLNDFVAYGDLHSLLGTLSSDVSLKISPSEKLIFSGNLRSTGFEAGKLFGSENILGKVSLNTHINGSGTDFKDAELGLEGKIDRIEINGYEYSNTSITGSLKRKMFNGTFRVRDKNLNLDFNGKIDFTQNPPVMDFNSEIYYAQPGNLNIPVADSTLALSGAVDVNFRGNNPDDLQGTALFRKIRIVKNDRTHPLGSVLFSSGKVNEMRTVTLSSEFADAEIFGTFNFIDLPLSLKRFASHYLPSIRMPETETSPPARQKFHYSIHLKSTSVLSDILTPDFRLPAGGHFSGFYDDSLLDATINGRIPSVTFGGTVMKGWNFNLNAGKKSMDFSASCAKISYTDSIFSDNINMILNAGQDTVHYEIFWGDHLTPPVKGNLNASLLSNIGMIKGDAFFREYPLVTAILHPSYITIGDSTWKIYPGNSIQFDTSSVTFNDLKLGTGKQFLKIDGEAGKNTGVPLNILLTDFSISNFRSLLEKSGIEIDGTLFGNLIITNAIGTPSVTSNLIIEHLSYRSDTLGKTELITYWVDPESPLQLEAKLYRGKLKTVTARGTYDPHAAGDKFDVNLILDKLKIYPLEEILGDIFTNIDGVATGSLHLGGDPAKPVIEGSVKIQRARLTVDYLQTRYSFAHDIQFRENEISIHELIAYDMKGNKAIVNGQVSHDYFKNFRFDFTIETKNVQCLNTNFTQNDLYYGQAFATGICKIKGDVDNVEIDISAKSEKGTQVFIPLSGAAEVSEQGFITFKNPPPALPPGSTDTLALKTEGKPNDLTGIQLNFNLEVTPDAEVQIVFDEKVGDIIKGRGNGNLKMYINTKGDFNMYGDFIIEKGDYLFTLKNVINKRFEIEKGGTIKWNGDPYDADINLVAVYSLRASLADLNLRDTTTAGTQRVPVDCRLMLSDKLMNPVIHFDIDLPGANDEQKSSVKTISANEQEMNKQIFSLLVLGRFQAIYNPYGESGVEAGGSAGANTTEFLSNQLSNWLSRISDDFDIGVKYRPGDNISGTDLELALSTQLFNDRLTVNGNVGTTGAGSQSASSIVGDVNLEYLLSKDGKFRVKAFHDSNDYTAYTDQAPYKQGVGISYRKEFNSFRDLFRKKKMEKEMDTGK